MTCQVPVGARQSAARRLSVADEVGAVYVCPEAVGCGRDQRIARTTAGERVVVLEPQLQLAVDPCEEELAVALEIELPYLVLEDRCGPCHLLSFAGE